MSRSLLIFVVTVVVVGAAYFGFSRYAANSRVLADDASRLSLPSARTATPNAVAPTPAPSLTPAGVNAPTASPLARAVANTEPGKVAAARAPDTFAIVIDKAHPPAPSDVIRVSKGDQVTLSITSDRAGHLEVHGYKKEVQVEPGTRTTLSFAAVRTGRFPIDLHASDGAHVEVTALEVMPK